MLDDFILTHDSCISGETNRTEIKRSYWTYEVKETFYSPQEDTFLGNLISQSQIVNWKEVEVVFQKKFPSSHRNARQIKQR